MCGIYAIRHLASGRSYIGSSKNIYKRWAIHRATLKSKTHHNLHLQNAWNKHAEADFVFEILAECSVDQLLAEETRHLDLTRLRYNIAAPGSFPLKMPSANRPRKRRRLRLYSWDSRRYEPAISIEDLREEEIEWWEGLYDEEPLAA